MSRRTQILLLSLAAFMVAGIGLSADQQEPWRTASGVLALLAAIFASLDLRRRGYRWGWGMLAAFLVQPVGLILYIIFSGRRRYQSDTPACCVPGVAQ